MSLLNFHHREIVKFLQDIRDNTSELSAISSTSTERRLLDTIIDSGEVLKKQKEVATELNLTPTYLRKTVQFNLNKLLHTFSSACLLQPPIQLYFNSKEGYVGGHFACCDRIQINESKSDSYIALDVLKKTLDYARQTLKSSSRQISFENPFMTIQKRLEPMEGRFPSLNDLLEGGSFYHDPDSSREVLGILEKNRRYLVVGLPGSGKTSFLVGIGYQLSQSGINVYYLDLVMESDYTNIEKIIQSADSNSLFILDNAHMKINEINSLVRRKFEAMLLISSRQIIHSVTFSRSSVETFNISYIDILENENALIQIELSRPAVLYILSHRAGKRAKISESSINEFIERVSGDYNIMYFFLQVWEKKGYSCSLSEISDADVMLYIYSTVTSLH